MTRESAKTVVNSLVVSKVDYCNSLLAACTQHQTDKLQRVLNCATRVILDGSKYDHVTPLIRDDLHWLCVPDRVTFKLLVYKALHGLAPVYIKSMFVPVSSSTARSSLCSASGGHLVVPHTQLEFGKRAFAFAGPTAWNSLPDIIRSTESINTFKRLRYLNPLYFQSHTLAFHFQLQHVIPLPCINCNVSRHVTARYKSSSSYYYYAWGQKWPDMLGAVYAPA